MKRTNMSAIFADIANLVARAGAAAPTNTTGGPRVAPQGGVLEGANPAQYSASNPVILFIIQVHWIPSASIFLGDMLII